MQIGGPIDAIGQPALSTEYGTNKYGVVEITFTFEIRRCLLEYINITRVSQQTEKSTGTMTVSFCFVQIKSNRCSLCLGKLRIMEKWLLTDY